jgi:hypothetical protein
MAHLDPGTAHGHEAGLLGELERVGAHSRRLRGAKHRRQPSAALGSDQRQDLLRRVGQLPHPLAEHALHVPRQRKVVRQRLDTGQLRGRQRLRELDERQRIATPLLDEGIAHGRRDAAVGAASDQRRRRARVKPAHLKLGDLTPLEVPIAPLARREQHHNPLGIEPSGDEHERIRRRGIQPLSIVNEAQHRTRLRQLGQQRQACDRDQEAILARALLQPEGSLQRRGLRLREALDQPQRRPHELMQPRERQLGLRFNPARRQHVHIARALSGILQQRRLARAGLPPQDQRAAARRPRRIDERSHAGALDFPPVQHKPILRARGPRHANEFPQRRNHAGEMTAPLRGRPSRGPPRQQGYGQHPGRT